MFHLFAFSFRCPIVLILIALFLLPLLDPPSGGGQEEEKRKTRVRRETAINATLFVMSGSIARVDTYRYKSTGLQLHIIPRKMFSE